VQRQGVGHGSLRKLTPTRAAFARPGPRVSLFPDVFARMPPSDSLPPSATAPVPLAHGLPRCGCFFCASEADDTCTRHVSCVGDGSPALRHAGICRGEARASQVTGPSSSYVPWSHTPPETTPSSPSNACRGWLVPSGTTGPWASGKVRGCGAACPMAHTCACRRIAGVIAGPVARLATGSGGLTLGRAGCAPAGRHTKFHEGIASSSPN
jgi:hypothetical protein